MKDIFLPPPELSNKAPLMKALQERRTKRRFKSENLSLQEISNLLWCACGETMKSTNRTKNKRTVPSACNAQLIDVYACLATGIYKYNVIEHKLDFVSREDVRGSLSTQKKLFGSVPFGLIFVGDFSKRTGILKSDEGKKMFLAGTETGLISQNVYLYCATTNLNTALIALVNRPPLMKSMGLSDHQVITYTQVIGYKG